MAWSKESRQSRGYGAAWDRQRKRILARDQYLCQPCKAKGRITPAKQVDHVKPRAEGGTEDDTNLQAICVPCHTAKTDAEAARAQGRSTAPRLTFDSAGHPIW